MRFAFSRTFGALASTTAMVLVVVGCGDGPTLVPVAGVVTLDGKPLEGATLSFVPAPGNAVSTPGSDATGPTGNFKMSFNGRSGLAPGKYAVMLSKTEEDTSSGKKIPPEFAKASVEKLLMGVAKETIPPQKLTREVEVPPEGVTDFDLDFKSKSDAVAKKK
jgi:hypothetical protein